MSKKRKGPDEVGHWTEIKLAILNEYAHVYTQIVSRQNYSGKKRFESCYIDAFAGHGYHISRTSGEMVPGSPVRALSVEPPFDDFIFIDLNENRVREIENLSQGYDVVPRVFHGDANDVLLNNVLPLVQYKDYRRGLCLLDPYGFHLHWKTMEEIGKAKSLEVLFNFSIMDINQNMLRRNIDMIDPEQADRMTLGWGDESWKDISYEQTLFDEMLDKKPGNEAIVQGYKNRLHQIAGFPYVTEPLPMRIGKDGKGAIVYYLFFASHNQTGHKIASHIFDKYRS